MVVGMAPGIPTFERLADACACVLGGTAVGGRLYLKWGDLHLPKVR